MEAFGRYALDLKLGLRMLRRSWGLTLVGGFAITVVVALATGSMSFLHTTLNSTVPLDEGERLVGLSMWDGESQRRVPPSLAQFGRWRDTLRSVEDLAAFKSAVRRLSPAPGVVAQPITVAEMTASGFRAARVPVLLGRTFVESDESAGAAPVVVIGYDVWQSRFDSDPGAIGEPLRLSGADHEIIGVMPEGFGFPVNHAYWTPLRSVSAQDETEVFVFGRLAEGHEIGNAQAEVEAIDTLLDTGNDAIESTPQVLPYTLALIGSGEPLEKLAAFGQFLISLLLLPPCLNIAILVYARTVTRQEELATRYALGASRSRIVTQLFFEVFILAALSAGIALLLVHAFFDLDLFRSQSDPFWIDYTQVSLATVPFAAGLAVMAALIAGTIPALQITTRLSQQGLAMLGNRSTTRLGATWTVLVVAQVAFAVAALPAAIELGWGKLRPSLVEPGFAADRIVTFELGVETDALSSDALDRVLDGVALQETQRRLAQRLEAEPDIAAATASSALPGAEPWGRIEIDSAGGEPSQAFEYVQLNRVDANFLSVFDIAVIAGRGIETADLGADNLPVVVNRTLAERMGGRTDGRRIRIAALDQEAGGWGEIVGIVADHPANSDGPRVYLAQGSALARPRISLRLGSAAADITTRLPGIAASVDPSLYVENVRFLSEVFRQIEIGNSVQFLALAAVMLSLLSLSVAGTYALLSFTVNRRRQEIGVRSALGAQPSQIVIGIFRRALWQLGAGVLLGLATAVFLDYLLPMERVGGRAVPGVLPFVAVTTIVIGCLAALAPARRALKIAPTSALRDNG